MLITFFSGIVAIHEYLARESIKSILQWGLKFRLFLATFERAVEQFL